MRSNSAAWLPILYVVLSAGLVKAGEARLSEAARTEIVQVLQTGLSSDQFWPSMHAAEALTLAGQGDEVRTALTPRLSTTEDAQHRCGIARELFRAGDKSAANVLLEILADEDPHGHGHACESLFKISQTGDGQLLREHMQNTDHSIKQLLAAAALARSGDTAALVLLRQQLANEDDNTARIAAWILAVVGQASDLPALRDRLKTIDDSTHQIFFVATMATLGDEAAGKQLQAALHSEDPAVRVFAAEFCGHARLAGARDTLLAMLDDEDLDVRIRAAQSLLLLEPNALP
ncbi:hypothetical protein Poly24_29450 [Rosistilla carotiformis]|uniref:HEAT repeat protein n=1 Tax=Rosistilla carotiformis TaxID=2528017 RepID=A0A518JUK4_9BACT|nr:HEAT repeat domain-containing protein [Rosistilla carotiformis]QDV69230.1 hypothetical protein Poly24_29450 [Rosistilla carotiformis]